MMLTLGEIAEMLAADLDGDAGLEITGVAGLEDAGPTEISFMANPKYEPLLATTRAGAVLIDRRADPHGRPAVRCDDPYLAFGRLLAHFAGAVGHHTGRHPNAEVAPSAQVHPSAALHAGVVVEPDAVVAEEAILYPGVVVGARSRIGSGALLYPNVVVRPDVQVGARAIFHSGVVVGATPSVQPMSDAAHDASPATPTVVIEDDVELGSHTTIEGGRDEPTRIGAGTKVDNLVHIGAGAQVGPACLIVAQVGIGAGAQVGTGVTLAGQATILPQVRVGDGAIVAAKAGVEEDVPPGQLYSGAPARPHEEQRHIYAALRRLPRSRHMVAELERRIRALEEATGA